MLPAWLRAVESDPERTAIKLITPDTDRAIARGIAYLAEQQTEDGAFGTSGYQRNVAICALSGMATPATEIAKMKIPTNRITHTSRCYRA